MKQTHGLLAGCARGFLVVATLVGCAAACGANEGPPNPVAQPEPQSEKPSLPYAFRWFCAGQLKVQKKLLRSSGPGGWNSTDDITASPGTTILVGTGYHRWDGYVLVGNGVPMKIEAELDRGIVLGEDFTSDCAQEYKQTEGVYVLLAKSSFYGTEELTGEACSLPAGTMLSGMTFRSAGDKAEVSSYEIQESCKLSSAYTLDMVYAQLVAR